LRIQDVELILAITFGKDQGLARRKREKERVTPEFGERKEEKILPPNSGRYTFEGVVNALSREGCMHFEVFDRSDEDFERRIF
jgi:hypothetical protein